MEKKFTVLRIIGTIYKVLAWVVLVLGILAALGFLAAGIWGEARAVRAPGVFPRSYVPLMGIAGGIFGALGIALGAGFYFLLLYAISEAIYLALAIEENTRETARYLRSREVSVTLPPSVGE
ncbi:MAG: hypothetical protein H8E90_00375 [Anaerolineales bacterium]|nr:hypothetical protein [Anaerolineales bacterium]